MASLLDPSPQAYRPVGAVVAAASLAVLIYQPGKLVKLLLLPIAVLLILLFTVFFHLFLSYCSALAVARSLTARTKRDRVATEGNTDRDTDAAVPLLSIATPSGLEAIWMKRQWVRADTSFRAGPLHPGSATVSAALDRLIAIVLENYLCSWYRTSISPSDPAFPNAVERTIREVLADIRERLVLVDWARLGVSTLLPKITAHLQLFAEAQQSMTDAPATTTTKPSASGVTHAAHNAGPDKAGHPPAPPGTASQAQAQQRKKKQSPIAAPASEELDLLLAEKYASLLATGGNLHPAVSVSSFNSRPSEEKHLRAVIDKILAVVMPPREGNSRAVNVVAMEIVACAVIRPIIEAVTDPDIWNKLLDEKAGAALREQRMVNKLRAALDATPILPATPTASVRRKSEDMSVKSTPKQFEAFLRSLNRCPTLLEAKRLRNDIEINLRRARFPGAHPDEPSEAILRYIDRLVLAKQAIDKRIAVLGGAESSSKAPTASSTTTLHHVLHQPGALGFFMEHMDRKHRSMLVQFYLTVEGLKDPLEDDDDLAAPGIVTSRDALQSGEMGAVDSAIAQSLRDDTQLLLSTYLRTKAVNVDTRIIDRLQAFHEQVGLGAPRPVPKTEYRRIRRTIFAAQAQVYDEMKEIDWPTFQRSDLFVKAIAELPVRTIQSDLRYMGNGNGTGNGSSTLSGEPEFVLPSNASGSSRHSLPSSPPMPNLRMQPPRPLPTIKRAGTASALPLDSRAPSKGMTRRSTDLTARDDLFGADKLDFLTGSATGNAKTEEDRSPLFRDDTVTTGLSTQADLHAVREEPDDKEQLQTMEAIQDALSSILASDDKVTEQSTLAQSRSRSPSVASQTSMDTSSLVSPRAPGIKAGPGAEKSLGATISPTAADPPKRPFWRLRTPSSQSQLNDDSRSRKPEYLAPAPEVYDQEGDPEKHLHDSADDLSGSTGSLGLAESAGASTRAAPSVLELPVEIDRIAARVDKLENQENVLSALLRKAELTGSQSELKILQKSMDALRREISELSFQKRQFETQESESRLAPGRTSVSITGTSVGQAPDGRPGGEFAVYLVEVHQLAEDGVTQTAGWMVPRRFSEFVALHSALKEKYQAVRTLELPGKRLVTSLSTNLIQQRKVALEKYLQAVVQIPPICTDRAFRAFLSQQNIGSLNPKTRGGPVDPSAASAFDIIPGQGAIRNLFRTVTTGMDDLFGGPSMLDALIVRLSQQAADFAGSVSTAAQTEDLISSVFGSAATARSTGSDADAPIDLLALSAAGLTPVDGEGLTYFTTPIADLLVEIFDLKDSGSWLRRQAMVIILQQVLGGTIERKVREAISINLSGDALLPHIEMITNLMWPDGKVRPPSIPRTAEEKLQTRESAYRKLAHLMPDVAASIIGRSNARRGARRIFAVMQNRRLNQHLVYTLLDDILGEIFGPSVKGGSSQ